MNRRPPSSAGGLVLQVQAAEKVLSMARVILGCFAAILLWAARLQWNVADLQRQVTETAAVVAKIQEDRREHIKEADLWRAEADKANIKRDMLIEQLAKSAIAVPPPRGSPR